ncbi:MAG: cytochrome c [Bacteroidetes bacterium]|jgi:nitric oxide reductase subunit C|nr:cytochrome c [Bacteroidota bacterium]MBK6818593.1 cytochrome c [Bacteroidota bacterium]MBK7041228.1 cytochrome c [Bacteroidota bacterium]MBK7588611.1 cytochrome c [Bacteroidota bacterium]MBK8328703.1 cytochrome c [Bacteroidota bacterium]
MNFEKNKIIITIGLFIIFTFYSIILYTSVYKNDQSTNDTNHDGKLIWQKYNCGACHQIYGLGGYLGPDLTNEYAKRSEAFIIAFIKNGNNTMPQFDLTDQELHSLMQFLKLLDSSGSSDPRTFKINTNGSIEQE